MGHVYGKEDLELLRQVAQLVVGQAATCKGALGRLARDFIEDAPGLVGEKLRQEYRRSLRPWAHRVLERKWIDQLRKMRFSSRRDRSPRELTDPEDEKSGQGPKGRILVESDMGQADDDDKPSILDMVTASEPAGGPIAMAALKEPFPEADLRGLENGFSPKHRVVVMCYYVPYYLKVPVSRWAGWCAEAGIDVPPCPHGFEGKPVFDLRANPEAIPFPPNGFDDLPRGNAKARCLGCFLGVSGVNVQKIWQRGRETLRQLRYFRE